MDAQKISLRNGRPASAGSETDDDNASLLVKASQMKREPPKINPVERLSDRRTGLPKVITYTWKPQHALPQRRQRRLPGLRVVHIVVGLVAESNCTKLKHKKSMVTTGSKRDYADKTAVTRD
ncbi:hypothetical protein B296_00024695 [Ensete ventricosum]|uniref:Uncharacterized protein n=1 Tax=Ensete ventricosum TaxID=4639 RepID=A0A427ANC6_ENSVE|nr:hypothetical protein B296_00024695 [Ensete ventricosum]